MSATTPAAFRAVFPEFADTGIYSDAAVLNWIGVAALRLNDNRWGALLEHGTQLFVAHNLALSRQAALAAASGAAPGSAAGPVASKAVDKVSVSYDTGSAASEGAGHFNLTAYGTRFWELANQVGIGGAQL